MINLFDIACNFSSNRFDNDLNEVIQRAKNNNVTKFLVVSASLKDAEKVHRIYQDNKDSCFFTIGVHPHHANEFDSLSSEEMIKLIEEYKPHSIGETGLDFFRNVSSYEEQLYAFDEQIKIAIETNLPLFLHQRDAHEDFIDCLNKETPRTKCVVHCFTGEKKELFNYLDRDFYIGLTGWICDPKRGSHLEELIPLIPLNRLLIETDSPYLLPKNLKVKGRRNEPAFLNEILKKVVSERKESEKKITEMLSKNSLSFFNLQQ